MREGEAAARSDGEPRRRLWRRHGLVLQPPEEHTWWHSHAQAPTILPIDDRLWRVYFGAREQPPRSRILCADLDPGDGFRVLRVYPDPVLPLGAPGTFDSHGMGPSTVLRIDGRIHLYYTGMALRSDVPYQLAIGLAISDDGLTFRRAGEGPVLSIGPHDPLFVSTPCVRRTSDGFAMWFASGVAWRSGDGGLDPFYVIRHTRSADGVFWSRATEWVFGSGTEDEAGLVRPWVVEGGEGLQLWYSRRGAGRFRTRDGEAYRLHEAMMDGDHVVASTQRPVIFENPPAEGDWDGWMQAYACIQPLGDDLIMLYNGNDFGRGGFGYARLNGGMLA